MSYELGVIAYHMKPKYTSHNREKKTIPKDLERNEPTINNGDTDLIPDDHFFPSSDTNRVHFTQEMTENRYEDAASADELLAAAHEHVDDVIHTTRTHELHVLGHNIPSAPVAEPDYTTLVKSQSTETDGP